MSLIDTLRVFAITVRNEKKNEANSAVRIGDLFLAIIDFIKGVQSGEIRQEGVDTYNDTSEGKTSLLNKYPNPELNWTVLVRKDETNGKKSSLYKWNGSQWINLETVVYSDDVATKQDIPHLFFKNGNIPSISNIIYKRQINTPLFIKYFGYRDINTQAFVCQIVDNSDTVVYNIEETYTELDIIRIENDDFIIYFDNKTAVENANPNVFLEYRCEINPAKALYEMQRYFQIDIKNPFVKDKNFNIRTITTNFRFDDMTLAQYWNRTTIPASFSQVIEVKCNINSREEKFTYAAKEVNIKKGIQDIILSSNVSNRQVNISLDWIEATDNIASNNEINKAAVIVSNSSIEQLSTGVALGDSIMQGVGVLPQGVTEAVPTDDCVSVMQTELGNNMINGGIGGTTFAKRDGSFYHVVQGIVNNDWGNIDNFIQKLIVENTNQGFAGLVKQYEKIKALDFSKVDFLIIAYGTNDWNMGFLADNTDNKEDIETTCGSLRWCVRTLLSAYPDLRLYIAAPSFRRFSDGSTSDSILRNGINLKDFSDKIEECCSVLKIPCYNQYIRNNFNEFTINRYSTDGTHRNAIGYKLLGKQYSKFIQSN